MPKVHYDAEGRRLPRIPSVHSRFVTRAGTLTTDRHFLATICEAQAAWNDKYRHFPIALAGPPPREPWGHPVNEFAYPRAWYAENWAMAERLQRRERLTDADGVTQLAGYEWRQLVLRLCGDWWPAKYYPVPVGNRQRLHPCTRFVSICLVWHPRFAHKEFVIPYGFGVESLRYDLTEYGSNPDARLWERAFNGLYERIAVHVDGGSPITREMLDRAVRESHRDAWEAGCAESPPLDPRKPFQAGGDAFQFVRLHPAMTTADWQGMEAEVMRALDRSALEPDPRGEHARELHRQGQSGKAIAHLLGVTPRAIRYYLAGELDNNDEVT